MKARRAEHCVDLTREQKTVIIESGKCLNQIDAQQVGS